MLQATQPLTTGPAKMYANALFQLIVPLAARPRHRAAPVRHCRLHQVNPWSAPVINLAIAETALLLVSI